MNNEKPDSINIYKKLKKRCCWLYKLPLVCHRPRRPLTGPSCRGPVERCREPDLDTVRAIRWRPCIYHRLSPPVTVQKEKKTLAPMKKVNRQPILYIIYIYFLGGIVLFVCVYSHIILCPCKWETLRRCEIFVCRSGERQWGHYHPSPSAKDATAIVFCPYVTAHRLGKR